MIPKTTTINLEDVCYLASDINYTKIHFLVGRASLSSYTLKHFEKSFPNNFVRIHRGFMVNRKYILEATAFEVKMQCGTKLAISRRRLAFVTEQLK